MADINCSYKYVSIGIKAKDLEEKIEERSLEEAKEFTFRVFSAKMPDTIPEKQYTKWFYKLKGCKKWN